MSKTIFTENLPKKQLHIVRDFDASPSLVWKTWTEPTYLNQWWAPKPWKAETKTMEFREGGYWLYCMNGPEGEQHWARADYEEIRELKSFKGLDSFCDENGKLSNDLPGMHWYVQFHPNGPSTKVEVIVTFTSENDLKTIVEMGFKEGFSAAHDNLDELLVELVSKSV